MEEVRNIQKGSGPSSIFPILMVLVSIVGILDAVYLTAHHYKGAMMPCIEGFDCEKVLTSSYAQFYGIPTAVFGLAAYFTVFSLSVLAIYGYRNVWNLLNLVVTLMAVFSIYLVYLQGFVLKAFCQYCLISAAVTFSLFFLVLMSRFFNSVKK